MKTESKIIICKCRKTKCLKSYCECYQAGQPCKKECNCYDCYNNDCHKHDPIVLKKVN